MNNKMNRRINYAINMKHENKFIKICYELDEYNNKDDDDLMESIYHRLLLEINSKYTNLLKIRAEAENYDYSETGIKSANVAILAFTIVGVMMAFASLICGLTPTDDLPLFLLDIYSNGTEHFMVIWAFFCLFLYLGYLIHYILSNAYRQECKNNKVVRKWKNYILEVINELDKHWSHYFENSQDYIM